MVTVTIDPATTITPIPKDAVSVTISTYGNTVIESAAQQAILASLKPGAVRIPLQWNGGNVVSSAGGGPHDSGIGDQFIDHIIAMGADPVIVIGGSSDNNFTPQDAAAMARHYLGKVKHYIVGNEPGNGGMSVQTYASLFNATSKAIKAIDPSLTVAGPAWAYYDHTNLTTFMDSCNGNYDLIDYHHYGMGGGAPVGTDAELAATSDWGNEVSWIRSQLDGRGLQHVGIEVGEYNWAWRYADGIAGGDKRFFQAPITVWAASLIGHVLASGGLSFAYSDQNGPLGITVEPGNNDQGRPGNSPQPIYWGLAAWTTVVGAIGTKLVKTSSDNSAVEAWATDTKVLIINKSSAAQSITIGGVKVTGLAITNPSAPYDAPKSLVAANGVALPGYSLAVLAVAPLVVTPPVVVPPVVVPPVVTPPATTTGFVIDSTAPTGWVDLVQRLLIKDGYTNQQINGGYGVTTTANVTDFQTKHGLPVTGVVDETTLDKLIG